MSSEVQLKYVRATDPEGCARELQTNQWYDNPSYRQEDTTVPPSCEESDDSKKNEFQKGKTQIAVSSSNADKESEYDKTDDSRRNEAIGKDDDEVEDDDDEDDDDGNVCSKGVNHLKLTLYHKYRQHKQHVWITIYAILFCLYVAYFTYSLKFRFGDEGSWRLVVCSGLVLLYVVWRVLEGVFGESVTLSHHWNKIDKPRRQKLQYWGRIVISVLLALGAVVFIIIFIARKNPRNLVSLGGLAVFIFLFYVFSHNPAKVNWRPVFWGIIIQFYFALLILRWNVGCEAFQWLGDRITEFLAYTNQGAKFVFGENYEDHFFAFKSEAPLMIRPFLAKMTKSELHAICTGGFATVAGSTLGGYIAYKVPANHLLSASVMSAPAALAMAKLFYPETKKSRTGNEVYNIPSGEERNILEAAAKGASESIKLVANVAVNLVAFIALIEFLNQTLIWFGNRAGMENPHKELTFQLICSYVFYPIAFLMGVDPQENNVFKVAELIGYKTFVNEFYAYGKLSVYINNRENLTWYENLPKTNPSFTGRWHYDGDDIVYEDFNHTLEKGLLTERSIVITTYALCGFANISSIGIMLGALGAMAPNQRSALAQVVVRAMIAGTVACFMTACIASNYFIIILKKSL
ncbi:solute carrier family 28 member 3-like isoform X3 [Ostrea edulis]|uniref:solute carrier family 28 member 3-like isoform X3 n=1 Tax=Ostrea edulis TaxID=37623 RepID=UPI0024AE9DE1|nr:solute carrier family 28 member 3-like isoform X3 [Ostrea edulis]